VGKRIIASKPQRKIKYFCRNILKDVKSMGGCFTFHVKEDSSEHFLSPLV
jgi:hypothetical protein